MPSYIIGTPKFIECLDNWIGGNDQAAARWIWNNRSGIPDMFSKPKVGTLYRGLLLDADREKQLLGSGLTLTNFTSWSKSRAIAEKFHSDPAFSTYSNRPGRRRVILKKRVPTSSVVLDIHSFVLFMGSTQLEMLGLDELSCDSALKEEEILVKSGLRVTARDLDE